MVRSKKALLALVAALFAVIILFAAYTDPVSADSSQSGVHADPTTFEKNFVLSVDQKAYAITEIKRIVDTILEPEMSDLEKYYTLALWEHRHVKYDGQFWCGGYYMEYYRHQWDAYGALKEKSVCAGMAMLYANLCHAADLPCRFVRLDPDVVDHTINYIPDINGNAYYVDVTENIFLMSENSGDCFSNIDKEFAHITRDCTDETFDYLENNTDNADQLKDKVLDDKDEYRKKYEDGDVTDELHSTKISDCYGKSFDEWFREYALHQNTDKIFGTDYVEKGSGTRGTHYASFANSPSQYHYPDNPEIWFLEDFYKNPSEVKAKILNKEFDEQLVDISGLQDSYDSESESDLENDVREDIILRYFPSAKNGKVVVWEDSLKSGIDYDVSFDSYDDEKGEAVLNVEASEEGGYKGSCQIRVKWTPRRLIDDARVLVGACSIEETMELVPRVSYYGEVLDEGTDYTWEKINPEDTFDKPGDYEVLIIGKGNYKGKVEKVFHIVIDEEEAEAAVKTAKEELALAQAAVAALDDTATTADIAAALRGLVAAQKSLTDAQEALGRTKDVLTKEKLAELREQISQLEQQYEEENAELQEKVDNLTEELYDATVIDISRLPYMIILDKTSYPYTGKAIEPAVRVPGLDEDDYTVSYSDNTEVGTATVTVKATGLEYKGTIQTTFEITKNQGNNKVARKANTLAVKGRTVTLKRKKIKKKSKTLDVTKVIRVTTKGQGAMSYAKVSGHKKITINENTGKVTVKKGLKKGTYQVVVNVKAAGDTSHNASAWKAVTFTVRVK